MFPPAPIALVDKDTGGVQKPKAGVLGSHDSVTGAPQNFKGEAAEQEARLSDRRCQCRRGKRCPQT